jgi:hypothetical protein
MSDTVAIAVFKAISNGFTSLVVSGTGSASPIATVTMSNT